MQQQQAQRLVSARKRGISGQPAACAPGFVKCSTPATGNAPCLSGKLSTFKTDVLEGASAHCCVKRSLLWLLTSLPRETERPAGGLTQLAVLQHQAPARGRQGPSPATSRLRC